MADAMDVEAAHEVAGETRHHRILSVLVGITAVVAALLALLEMHSGKHEESAFARGSRLSEEVSRSVAASGQLASFRFGTLQDALALGVESSARGTVASTSEDADALASARSTAEMRAADRLSRLVEEMGAVPDVESGVDPATRRALGATFEALSGLVREQNRQVDLAERYGDRENRAIFGLSLLAVAAVLLGLAAIVGPGRPGFIVLVAATAALAVSAGWGASALLL